MNQLNLKLKSEDQPRHYNNINEMKFDTNRIIISYDEHNVELIYPDNIEYLNLNYTPDVKPVIITTLIPVEPLNLKIGESYIISEDKTLTVEEVLNCDPFGDDCLFTFIGVKDDDYILLSDPDLDNEKDLISNLSALLDTGNLNFEMTSRLLPDLDDRLITIDRDTLMDMNQNGPCYFFLLKTEETTQIDPDTKGEM